MIYINMVLMLLILTTSDLSSAAQLLDKTPKDTYDLTLLLTNEVKTLQQEQGVTTTWPTVVVHGLKGPRHEYQKALEVLSKINRYRVIHKLGAVATPYYPSRKVTPNEVYDLIQRLIHEIRVLHGSNIASETKTTTITTTATREKNYQQLWEVSKAFDPLLGVRGFLPSDVFAQSQRIVALVRFLRISQNSPSMPPKPKKTQGKHPNHALAAAYQLLTQVRHAEQNLWMDPVTVPLMEKRVITPTEVYDALQTNIAELQRIKFRLGLERAFSEVKTDANKTPDDVIQNLRWAAHSLPKFPFNKPLIQYDPRSLEKSPNDVFLVAQKVLQRLRHYKKLRGIRTKANRPREVIALQPRHVYQKTLECLKKVMVLRQQTGFSASATPYFPMRIITPNDVFALATRLDRALNLVYETIGMAKESFETRDIAGNKTPSDVFRVMWQISYELDTILNSQGQTPNDVFQMASYVVAHIQRIQRHLDDTPPIPIPTLVAGMKPADVIVQAHAVLKTIGQLKVRAGMFATSLPIAKQDSRVTPNDVFNLVSVIIAELTEIEIHFGISEQLEPPPSVQNKRPSDVHQQLTYAKQLLHELLKIPHE